MPLMYNGEKIKRLMWMGNVIMEAKDEGGSTPTSAAEWAANPAALKVAADDIAVNGTSSAYYAEFAQYMADDASFPITLRNVDSYTSVEADKIMQMRIVGINCKATSANGNTGLTFMAKKAHPKANTVNSSSSTTGGWPSMSLRTDMNSGTFWNTLPTDWQNIVEEVINTSYGPSGQVTSSDKMWLPSWYELCGSDSTTSYQTNDGPQLPWFASKGTTNSAVKSTLAGMYLTNSGAQPSGLENTRFWTRSVFSGGTGYFVYVVSDGSRSYGLPNKVYAILPCFAIGEGGEAPRVNATISSGNYSTGGDTSGGDWSGDNYGSGRSVTMPQIRSAYVSMYGDSDLSTRTNGGTYSIKSYIDKYTDDPFYFAITDTVSTANADIYTYMVPKWAYVLAFAFHSGLMRISGIDNNPT